jgi:4-amino-4-deoxy-L-arabinose transferase-like glycosyltransferase
MKPIVNFLMKKEGSQARDILFLLVLFGVLFFLFLGRFPLIEPDEGRYAEIPREMIELGDFITPHLNYVKYFEKPPLYYWMTAFSFVVFGQNEFGARFPAALCGLLGVLLTYFIGRNLFDRRTALLSALVLGSSVGYLAQGRITLIDMALTFCLTASLGFFLLASREGEKKKGLYYHLFYLFAALTVLAKGLIGIVLPGAVIFSYLLFSRRWKILREMRLLTGIPLFVLIAAPWFVLVSIKNPEFARFFFIHEHFERYLTKVHGRYKPPWFFIPVLIGVMIPWSFFIPTAARTLWRERKGREGDTVLYLFLWATVIFVFFSLSDSKLVPYILPVLPAAALLIGKTFSRVFEGESDEMRIEMWVGGIFLFILGTGIILYPHVVGIPRIGVKEAGAIGGLFLCEGLLLMTVLRKSKIVSLFAALVLLSCILGICAPLLAMEDVSEWKSSKRLGLIIRENAGKDALVASYAIYRQGFSFYAGRRVIVVDAGSELEFGSLQGDHTAWFMDSARFSTLWGSSRSVYVLVSQNDMEAFRASMHTPARIVGQSADMLLVCNR